MHRNRLRKNELIVWVMDKQDECIPLFPSSSIHTQHLWLSSFQSAVLSELFSRTTSGEWRLICFHSEKAQASRNLSCLQCAAEPLLVVWTSVLCCFRYYTEIRKNKHFSENIWFHSARALIGQLFESSTFSLTKQILNLNKFVDVASNKILSRKFNTKANWE